MLKVDKQGFLKVQQKYEEVKGLRNRLGEPNAAKMNKIYLIVTGLMVKNREDDPWSVQNH